MVDAARVPRVAAGQPTNGQPASLEQPEAGQCRDRVCRTARREPAARRKQWRDQDLIAANQPDERPCEDPSERHLVTGAVRSRRPIAGRGRAADRRPVLHLQQESRGSPRPCGPASSGAGLPSGGATHASCGCGRQRCRRPWTPRIRRDVHPPANSTLSRRAGDPPPVRNDDCATLRKNPHCRAVGCSSAALSPNWRSAGGPSGRDLAAALGATRRQDGAARTGAHPQAEAVHLGAAAGVGLEGALAHCRLRRNVWAHGGSGRALVMGSSLRPAGAGSIAAGGNRCGPGRRERRRLAATIRAAGGQGQTDRYRTVRETEPLIKELSLRPHQPPRRALQKILRQPACRTLVHVVSVGVFQVGPPVIRFISSSLPTACG